MTESTDVVISPLMSLTTVPLAQPLLTPQALQGPQAALQTLMSTDSLRLVQTLTLTNKRLLVTYLGNKYVTPTTTVSTASVTTTNQQAMPRLQTFSTTSSV